MPEVILLSRGQVAWLRYRLREAEIRVARAKTNVLNQLDFICTLERQGRDTTKATDLLRIFEQLLVSPTEQRDGLLKRLSNSERIVPFISKDAWPGPLNRPSAQGEKTAPVPPGAAAVRSS